MESFLSHYKDPVVKLFRKQTTCDNEIIWGEVGDFVCKSINRLYCLHRETGGLRDENEEFAGVGIGICHCHDFFAVGFEGDGLYALL